MHEDRLAVWLVVALTVLGSFRIIASYRDRPQGFDEAGHIAAGVELMDKGTYTIDPMHPPLGRTAIGLPLYLAGERYPHFAADDPAGSSYDLVGNEVLYKDGHYQRNLALGRLGVLPFFIIAAVVVFLWCRREFGDFAGVMAVVLFTTLPNVLAFAGLAYTDMVAAAMQCLCFYEFASWLDTPNVARTILLSVATALALLSKFTSLMFVPAAIIGMLLCKWFLNSPQGSTTNTSKGSWLRKVATISVIVVVLVWGGYGFRIGRVQEDMGLSPAAMPSFQHFPALMRSTARRAVVEDMTIPAPALLRGITGAWALSKTPLDSYLLGQIKQGGWWYFFLVGIAVKTPIPLLVLFLIGLVVILGQARVRRWQAIAPVACIAALLIATTGVKYDAGVRHVLPVFPLITIVAGSGCAYLWRLRWRGVRAGAALLAVLVLCQAVSSIRARHDYVGYFNALAGSDPSRVLLLGCDLDCGQDLYRLSADLKARGISDVKVAVWTTADLSQLGFPKSETLLPSQPVNGWIAVSVRSMRFGDVLRQSYPHQALSWLQRYQPVERIGNTISLYHITNASK